MTVVEQAAGQTPSSTAPLRPETTPSSSPYHSANHQPWSGQVLMPRLCEIVPGWRGDLKDHIAVVSEDGGGETGDGNGDSSIPPHRRRIVRTRTAPAGPHPYLDRFASGMHRPLEGDDASWRKASIEPVPIPDLGHTGIFTKFSTGTGNGFTPDGLMTENFRTDIHDAVRNHPRPAPGDARDMRTRDYAREARKHRVDPCGGSLLDAHMSSLELDVAAGARLSSPFVGGGGRLAGSGSLRQSSSLRTFRSRFSPPSSPLSTRRALAGYGRRRNGGVRVGSGGGRDFSMIPEENRQVILHRELRSVQLAVAAVGGCRDSVGDSASGESGWYGCGATPPSMGAPVIGASTIVEGSKVCSRGGNMGRDKSSTADCRPQAMPIPVTEVDRSCGGIASNGRRECRRSSGHVGVCEGGSRASGDDKSERSNTMVFNSADESRSRANQRARGKRQGRRADAGGGLEERKFDDGPDGGGNRLVLLAPNSRNSRRRTRPAAARKRKSKSPPWRRLPPPLSSSLFLSSMPTTPEPKSKPQSARYLKKPFSSDSLLSCLLDIRFGNTRDLSPEKPPGQKWDLRTLPAGIANGASFTAGGWDGFDESDDLGAGGDGEGRGLNLREAPRYSASGDSDGAIDVGDLNVLRGGGGGGDHSASAGTGPSSG